MVMLTAEQARKLMPKIDEELSRIDAAIRMAAARDGRTKIIWVFSTKSQVSRANIFHSLIKRGFSVAQHSPKEISISWKKLS